MRLLLDTHALIWSQDDTSNLSPAAVAALRDPNNDLVLSVVTVWEIGIKTSIGKLSLSKPFRTWVETAFRDLRLVDLPISLDNVERLTALPFHHKDPFDRLLAAQALTEAIPLISADAAFDPYGVTRLWT